MWFRAAYAAGLIMLCSIVAACGGGGSSSAPVVGATVLPALVNAVIPSASPAAPNTLARRSFLGAFFRPEGAPPFGVFSASSRNLVPDPYPTPGPVLFGSGGYCDQVAANGVSISSGYAVDPAKLTNASALGVRWTRSGPSSFFDDLSHLAGGRGNVFADFDAAQCALLSRQIVPLVAIEAGPVLYDAVPGRYSPHEVSTYQTPADFGSWCSAVARHETAAFPAVSRYSMPGNESNSNPTLFPGGPSQVASYAIACYTAIKTANPNAFVYGFELNMDGALDVPGFVRQMASLGCRAGTCYDGLAIHLTLRYPFPPASTPCYPKPGGDYVMQCISDIQSAAGTPVHVMVTEMVYPVPGSVPDETGKANAAVAALKAFAADASVDGVSYGNVDECGLYPSGYFANGCLVDTSGRSEPAYSALQQLANALFL